MPSSMWNSFLHLIGKSWLVMVEATGTNTLGFFVWTLALTALGWFATVGDASYKNNKNGIAHPILTAFQESAFVGCLIGTGVIVLVLVAWMTATAVTVYKDHNALAASIDDLNKRLTKREEVHLSLQIKGWIDNQDQNNDAIVQVWLGVSNDGEPETLKDWKLSIRKGNTIREGRHSIGQPRLKGGLDIPFLDKEFQRPVGVISDMQGYVTFGVRGINQNEFDRLYEDRSSTLVISALDSKGRMISAEKNIFQTWLDGHQKTPAK